jgi:hypothetical protein
MSWKDMMRRVLPLGLFTGEPMGNYPFPTPSWGFPDKSTEPSREDWAWPLLTRPDWNNKAR